MTCWPPSAPATRKANMPLPDSLATHAAWVGLQKVYLHKLHYYYFSYQITHTTGKHDQVSIQGVVNITSSGSQISTLSPTLRCHMTKVMGTVTTVLPKFKGPRPHQAKSRWQLTGDHGASCAAETKSMRTCEGVGTCYRVSYQNVKR
jgi:hypothetical protein